MRYVLCDEDPLVRSMVETIVERQGNEVVGVADHTSVATDLIRVAHPDAVIVDLSLGYNTDFDVVEAAIDVGARVVVFSHNADHAVLGRYVPVPTVVPKPDFVALEEQVARLATVPVDADVGTQAIDRRTHLSRAAVGPEPTSIDDTRAFYEALANAAEGDVLASVEPIEPATFDVTAAHRVHDLVRATDRVLAVDPPERHVLAAKASVKVFLAGGGREGIDALTARLAGAGLADGPVGLRTVLIGPGDSSTDAFDRLKAAPLVPLAGP